MIQAVIFDVGGVLVRTYDQSGRREWEQLLDLQRGQLEAIVLNSDMGHKAQRGEITDADMWKWAAEYLGLGNNLEIFKRDFWRGDRVDAELVKLVRKLRQNYKMAILSNATDALRQTLDQYQLTDEFDIVIGSAYEGVMKPNPLIYERTLAKLERDANEVVFIDDAPHNVAAAAAVGINAIQFTAEMDLAARLREYGLNLD